MIRTARQLKDLIRNLSKEKSADAHILMRNYMMERFLERISFSEYRDRFVLKGGMLVAAMVGLDARSTMDLDATIKGVNVSTEDVEKLIDAIIAVPIDDGVSFQIKSIMKIMDEAEYPGIRAMRLRRRKSGIDLNSCLRSAVLIFWRTIWRQFWPKSWKQSSLARLPILG